MGATLLGVTNYPFQYDNGYFTGKQVYRVRTTDAGDTWLTAYNCAGIPVPGDTLVVDDSIMVVGKSVVDKERTSTHVRLWEVACIFSNDFRQKQIVVTNQNPLLLPPQINWGGERVQGPYFTDVNGDVACNSAGQPFDEFPQREKGEFSVTITRNEASFDGGVAAGWANAVNSDAFTIDGVSIGAGYARLGIITGVKMWDNFNNAYYQVSYPIYLRPGGWLDDIDDRGRCQLVTVGGVVKLAPILDKSANQVDKPYPLNGSGVAKANATDAPATITLQPYATVAFSPLGFV